MEPTIGKSLRDARLRKGLTPEEVSKATRIRADWITDLENEDYHRFPSLGYARNFQILYARYLGIDLKQGTMIDPGKLVLTTSFDHIYEGVTPIGYRGMRRPKPIRRSRWFLAFVVFAIACAIGAITALFILDVLRLPGWDELMGDEREPEERLVVPPPTEVPATEVPADPSVVEPTPTPPPATGEPPMGEDGTLYPPQPPPPEPIDFYEPSERLQPLLPPSATESFHLIPASDDTPEADSGSATFPFAADAEALTTPFPAEPLAPEAE